MTRAPESPPARFGIAYVPRPDLRAQSPDRAITVCDRPRFEAPPRDPQTADSLKSRRYGAFDVTILLGLGENPACFAFHRGGLQDFEVSEEYDAAICVGATHVFGEPGVGLRSTLIALSKFVRPKGRLLVGEGFWRRDPSQEYLEKTAFEAAHLTTHEGNIELGAEVGFRLIHAEISSSDEWDFFEGVFLRSAQVAFAKNREDAKARRDYDHWTAWHDAYQRWGRDTLGFGFYVFSVG